MELGLQLPRIRLETSVAGGSFSFCFADGSRVLFSEWNAHENEIGFSFLAIAQSMVQSGEATLDHAKTTLSISAEVIADLDEDRAGALRLPSAVPFTLEINARGRLGTLRLDLRWIDNNGLRVSSASRKGCFLETRERDFRIPNPLLQICVEAENLNARGDASPDEQAASWSEIQALIGITQQDINPSPFLERMRVARATSFTLDFVPSDTGGFQIAPVPLAEVKTAREADLTGGERLTEHQRLLSSEEQQRFQRAFRASGSAQSHYLGGNDVYILLSPEVKRSLEIVRKVQDRPEAERVAFAKNPFPLLKGELDSEPPFWESRSFSDRVIGLGALEKVTLPWQILGSQGWLPPKTVRIEIEGAGHIEIPPAELEAAIIDVELALTKGTATVTIAEQNHSASPALREALFRARDALDEAANLDFEPTQPNTAPKPSQRIGLQLARNLDANDYAARHRERSKQPYFVPELKTILKPHQHIALEWLQRRWAAGWRGALLADDMGLGKSLSALSFMIWLRSSMIAKLVEARPMLIVAPVSLLENWQAEHARHVGDSPNAFVDISRAYGPGLPRRASGRDIDTGSPMLDTDRLTVDRFGQPTCVLTTYETLRDYQQSFASVHFSLVVLDEVQRIKNPASLAWHATSALNADFWLALTGTPVENRLADLWAIADAIEPNYLGTLREFSKTYESDFDEKALRALKDSIETSADGAPFMLRRLKEHVLDGIPEKFEHLHPTEMPKVQVQAYNDIAAAANSTIAPKQMLTIVQQLREVSLHPLKPEDCSAQEYINASARFQALFKILDEIRLANERALIFLDRNIVEAYLARILQQNYKLSELPPIINGNVPGPKRQQMVDKFQNESGFGVMILSPKAGGVGLTLTAANHVIHLSRWWNPAVEDQSTDRAYRIGQRKPVHVHYLQATLPGQPGVAFDERLHALLQKKRALSRELLWPVESDQGDAAELLGR